MPDLILNSNRISNLNPNPDLKANPIPKPSPRSLFQTVVGHLMRRYQCTIGLLLYKVQVHKTSYIVPMLRTSARRSTLKLFSSVIAGVLQRVVCQRSSDISRNTFLHGRFDASAVSFVQWQGIRFFKSCHWLFQLSKRLERVANSKLFHTLSLLYTVHVCHLFTPRTRATGTGNSWRNSNYFLPSSVVTEP